MTVDELIAAAFRVLNVAVDGEDLETEDKNNAAEALNLMLASWADEGIIYPLTVEVTHTLTAGTESYTIGESSATIDTLRPELIHNAFIRDASNRDTPVTIIGEQTFNAIRDKQSPSTTPTRLFYKRGVPNGTINLHPSPSNSTDTLYMYVIRQFGETGSGAGWGSQDLSATLGYARTIHEALKWNLAVRLAPEYGPPPNFDVVVAMAQSSYDAIIEKNMAHNFESIRSPFAPNLLSASNEGLW